MHLSCEARPLRFCAPPPSPFTWEYKGVYFPRCQNVLQWFRNTPQAGEATILKLCTCNKIFGLTWACSHHVRCVRRQFTGHPADDPRPSDSCTTEMQTGRENGSWISRNWQQGCPQKEGIFCPVFSEVIRIFIWDFEIETIFRYTKCKEFLYVLDLRPNHTIDCFFILHLLLFALKSWRMD